MAYIGELDERRAWAVDGILSCVHWLSWRLGMGPNAAGERVRVARALRKLPRISEAFGEGRSVPHRHEPPWQPAQDLDPNGRIDADTLPPDGVDKLHLHYAVEILMQQAA
jgi:hypothetical protein